jgi:uncharacterized membrane protein YjgN (DUF898 family)
MDESAPPPADRPADADASAPRHPTAPSAGRLRRLEFTGRGGEYFRIWIVNLLLTLLTLGIYSAWAKVRRLQYFHRNTRLAGSAFDYHARPLAILAGRAVAVAGLLAYTVVSELEPLAAVALFALYLAGLPWIVHRALRFRLANTSWRGIRFGFGGTVGGAYRSLMLPVLGWGGALGAALAAVALLTPVPWAALAPAAFVGAYALVPLLHHRLKRYHHGRARLGTLEGEFTARTRQFYGIYVRTLLLAIALLASAVALVALVVVAIGGVGRAAAAIDEAPGGPQAVIGVALLAVAGTWFALTMLGPYFQARLQNLVWSRTRIGPHRFVSRVRARVLWAIRVTNFVLVAVSFGLWLPFAAVRVARYRIGSVDVAVLGDLDRIVATERDRVAAFGEEAADLFDLDIGL